MASLWCTVLASLATRTPTRCPYCPDRHEPHWIGWGCYHRWARGRRERISVDRHRCRFVGRTFSLLPDGLLPYHHERTADILQQVWALCVDEVPVSRWARLKHRVRNNVRRVRAHFEKVISRLRLPGHEGALTAGPFLRRLVSLGIDRVAQIFRDWKELEPKHSIVGIYAR